MAHAGLIRTILTFIGSNMATIKMDTKFDNITMHQSFLHLPFVKPKQRSTNRPFLEKGGTAAPVVKMTPVFSGVLKF